MNRYIVVCIWYVVLSQENGTLLTVSFLDVGQGDAVFMVSPSGRTVLIDGGPDVSVVRELGARMSWRSRSIDVMIATHPDMDHIGGLIDVLPRYRIGMIMQSSVQGSTAAWNTFEKEADEEGALRVTAQRGQIIDLGKGAYLEKLSPDRRVSSVDTNVGCVIARLVYGTTSFMFSCDAPRAVENYIASLDGATLKSNVLKAGHHGSRTSSSPLFVGYVDPQYVVYSRACKNTYGFPHAETVAIFHRFGVQALDTCDQGTITFQSDGKRVQVLQR